MTTEKPKTRELLVGSKNFISQLFFLWVFKFIFRLRNDKSDLKNFVFRLRKSERADVNDDILNKKWQEEISLAATQNR